MMRAQPAGIREDDRTYQAVLVEDLEQQPVFPRVDLEEGRRRAVRVTTSSSHATSSQPAQPISFAIMDFLTHFCYIQTITPRWPTEDGLPPL